MLRRRQGSCGELGFSETFPEACRGIRGQTGKAAPAPLRTVAPACGRLENRQSESVRNAGGEERKGRRGGKGAGSPHAAQLPMTKGREGGVRAGEGRGGKGEGEEAKGRGATRTDAKQGSARPSLWGCLVGGRGGTRQNAHHRSARASGHLGPCSAVGTGQPRGTAESNLPAHHCKNPRRASTGES